MLFTRKFDVLMVCTANICRSPLAEGLLRQRLRALGLHRKVLVRSAGTKASQPGHKPDPRARRVAEAVGVSLARIKAQQVTAGDLARSDCVLAMDLQNLRDLELMCLQADRHKLHLLLEFAPELGLEEVPDPYYGNYEGFEEVFRVIDAGLTGVSRYLAQELER